MVTIRSPPAVPGLGNRPWTTSTREGRSATYVTVTLAVAAAPAGGFEAMEEKRNGAAAPRALPPSTYMPSGAATTFCAWR
jgi:hypothetical protein